MAKTMTEKTLINMHLGGVFDHIGLVFTDIQDQKWFLPHFEKMLYDQAMISMAYLEPMLTNNKEYADILRKSLPMY